MGYLVKDLNTDMEVYVGDTHVDEFLARKIIDLFDAMTE